jgi:beta-phosphoglucomutase
MKKVEAVLFDMDGVIFDTERVYLDIWTRIFKRHGYKMSKDVYVSVMGRGRKNVIKTFLEVYGENLPIMQMYDEKDKELEQAIKEGQISVKIGAREILRFFKESGYKIGLATSAKRDRAMMQFKNTNIEGEFDIMVYGDDITKAKPNPEIFLKAAQKLYIKPENCIVIEDSPAGIEGAHKAKMIGIHVEDLKKADKEILRYCYKSFKNLLDIREYLRENIGKL